MSSQRPNVMGDNWFEQGGDRALLFVAISAALAATAVLTPLESVKPFFFGTSIGLFALVVLSLGKELVTRIQNAYVAPTMKKRIEGMTNAAVLSDRHGRILLSNRHAEALGGFEQGAHLKSAFRRMSVDPEATIARLIRRVRQSGIAEETIGTPLKSARIKVSVLSRGRLIWSLQETAIDPELAIMSLGNGVSTPNAAAETLVGHGVRPIGEVILDLPLKQGAVHKLRTKWGEEFSARLIELHTFGDVREVAVMPKALPQLPNEKLRSTALGAPDLLSVLPVPMLKVDGDGKLLEVNAEARSILSIGTDEMPPLFELVEGMGRPIADWLAEAVNGRGLLKPEIVRAVIPGQELFLQITLGRTVEDGRVVLVGILNDATELKTIEARVVQSQKMQAIGQLAGGVAHDFNNLLTAISGHCDLLLLRHDASDPDYADLIQISQNANRAASLVGQLLAFSRKQNLKSQVLDLRDTMVDLAHLLNRLIGERVQLEVTHAPGPQLIRADRRQLEQVIVNLVVNARDAMPDGGKIEVVIRTEFLAEEVSRDRAKLMPGEYVVIEVRDSGSGIPPDALAKIFEPFFTTKKTGEGTGLGLSTAYGIVKQTGGFIFVESEVGTGTTFSLYFPATNVVETAQVNDSTPEEVAASPRQEASILLVEDEAPVRAFACRALRLHGYTVIEAGDAEEALSVLEDTALNIDLFVTDVIMPGMDGPTWVRKALKQRPDTNVVFMSGYAEEGSAEKQARIPNSVFLPKPFSLQKLTNLVHEQLQ